MRCLMSILRDSIVGDIVIHIDELRNAMRVNDEILEGMYEDLSSVKNEMSELRSEVEYLKGIKLQYDDLLNSLDNIQPQSSFLNK